MAEKVVWFWFWFGLMLNVPVSNFSVMLGRSHRFLGITSTFGGGGIYVLLKDTMGFGVHPLFSFVSWLTEAVLTCTHNL